MLAAAGASSRCIHFFGRGCAARCRAGTRFTLARKPAWRRALPGYARTICTGGEHHEFPGRRATRVRRGANRDDYRSGTRKTAEPWWPESASPDIAPTDPGGCPGASGGARCLVHRRPDGSATRAPGRRRATVLRAQKRRGPFVVAGHNCRETRLPERIAHHPQDLGVVVEREDAGPLGVLGGQRRRRYGRRGRAGVGRRQREDEARAAARSAALGPDSPPRAPPQAPCRWRGRGRRPPRSPRRLRGRTCEKAGRACPARSPSPRRQRPRGRAPRR